MHRRRLLLLAALPLALPAPAEEAVPGPVLLHPGEDVAAVVARSPAGTRFRFIAGTYPLAEIVPKDGDRFEGEPGAVLSGARPIDGFRPEGAFWAAPLDLPPRRAYGMCRPGRVCDRPNELFIGGVRQEPVPGLEGLGPGRFFIDQAAQKVYLGGDPGGGPVELAVARWAFAGPAEHVAIAGLVIEKYANAAQTGAIGGDGDPVGWTIEHCEIRGNHGVGVAIADGGRVADSFIHDNGQLGVAGRHDRLVIERNEIARNNQAGFDSDWEAGGVKITRTIHAVLRGNFVHGNHGPGLWADIDAVDTVYDGNRVEDNDGPGIQHEISFEAVIRDNELRGNGRLPHRWVWNAQILVQNSRDVAVEDNRVLVPEGGWGIMLIEQRREEGPFGPHLVRDCIVARNAVDMAGESGTVAGLVTDWGASRVAEGGNRFDGDSYRVPDLGGRYWAWPGWQGSLDFASFRQRYGQELAGTIALARLP